MAKNGKYGVLEDAFGRPLRDLRISVTDRCNFRCTYCMPKEVFGHGYRFVDRGDLLTFEEIDRLVRIFAASGVEKIRITGGEPLMRRNVEELVAMLAAIEGVEVAMTTNGALLASKASALKAAGLNRLTVSLDSLEDETFRAMNDVNFPVRRVLRSIDAAAEVGFSPMKINMVVKRGVNENQVVPMAQRFKKLGHILRFIEFMDVGTTNGWQLDDVVPGREIVAMIDAEMPLEAIEPNYVGEVARRYRYKDGSGEIGVIASVTQPFCRGCSRARLSPEGVLYSCLFSAAGTDLRVLVRDRVSDQEIQELISLAWHRRTDRYSELRSEGTRPLPKVEMSYIGG